MALRVALILAAVPLLLAAGAAACYVDSVGIPTEAGGPFSGTLDPNAYDAADLKQHYEVAASRKTFLKVGKRQLSFSCVDSRSELPILGTPGGMTAELMGGIVVYLRQTAIEFSEPTVEEIVFDFINTNRFSAKQPFYLHSADSNLANVYKAVSARTGKKYVVLPDQPPAGEADIWYDELSKGVHQGCGHIKLMIDEFAKYNLTGPEVPRAVLKAYFKYWWPTPIDSKERSRVVFEKLLGPLSGKAAAIIDAQGSENCAKKRNPAIPSTYGPSQVFTYHAYAVGLLRKDVLAPYFVKFAEKKGKTLDEAAFLADLQALQGAQLTATLQNLSPVKNLKLFSVPLTSN
ncbi:hypothetical protein Rsub_07708 [Raphidocelis subcapitata]|uniref:Uncharacterized protein n=1 Tax=Raphidocelis subcapitata TaxID=307507 RepID=A0A2V0P5H7_9CHLO|nr:hypothetical protein Rsub_07708 [Raphidocelis subcapitata]|eukprot:GBF95124.1 hypothetical protein Rsub_07708 [Raphidocelis subcapitata]